MLGRHLLRLQNEEDPEPGVTKVGFRFLKPEIYKFHNFFSENCKFKLFLKNFIEACVVMLQLNSCTVDRLHQNLRFQNIKKPFKK